MQGAVSCAYRLACSPWCTWERKCFCDQAGKSSESFKQYEFGFIHTYLFRFSLPHFSISFLWGIAGRRAQESWVSHIRKLNERLPFSDFAHPKWWILAMGLFYHLHSWENRTRVKDKMTFSQSCDKFPIKSFFLWMSLSDRLLLTTIECLSHASLFVLRTTTASQICIKTNKWLQLFFQGL